MYQTWTVYRSCVKIQAPTLTPPYFPPNLANITHAPNAPNAPLDAQLNLKKPIRK